MLLLRLVIRQLRTGADFIIVALQERKSQLSELNIRDVINILALPNK
jgi:hypothetical protein